jgi:hypothetical protein
MSPKNDYQKHAVMWAMIAAVILKPRHLRRNKMTSLKTFVASAMLLSALAAPPVFAQTAVQEPGLQAFYHPNSDVLNSGVSANKLVNDASAYAAMEGGRASSCAQQVRSHNSKSRAVAAADNRQLRCQ